MSDVIGQMLLPVLLGDGAELLRNAVGLGQAYRVTSFAFTLRPHPFLSCFFPVRTRRLRAEELPFLCDLLAEFAAAQDDRILYLVPCSPAFRDFVEANRAFLEESYICAGNETERSHLFPIPQQRRP